jgi:hypothetical protein
MLFVPGYGRQYRSARYRETSIYLINTVMMFSNRLFSYYCIVNQSLPSTKYQIQQQLAHIHHTTNAARDRPLADQAAMNNEPKLALAITGRRLV